jgi:hypothetical protein
MAGEMPPNSNRVLTPVRRTILVLAGLFGLLLSELATGVSPISYTGHTIESSVADAPSASRGPSGQPAKRLLSLLVVLTSPLAEAHAQLSGAPDAPAPLEAPVPGLTSVEADDELNDSDDFAYHLRVVFDGTAQLNRIVEPGMSLGGRALSRLADNRSDKPPRS